MIFVFVLIAVNIGVVLWVAARSSFTRQGIEFNHVLMFSFGFLFYWIVPIIVGALHLFDTDPRMQVWYGIFDAIPVSTLVLYLVICLGAYLSFYGGSEWVRRRLAGRPPTYRKLFFYRRLLDIPLVVVTLIAVAFAFVLRDGLFKGYTVGFDPAHPETLVTRGATSVYGSFTASSVILLTLAFLYAAKLDEDTRPPFRRLLLNRYFLIYFFFSILVLSLGGREYFLCSLFMLLIYRSVYFQKIASRTTLNVFLGIFGLTGLFGLIRLGDTLSIGGAVVNVFIEPLWTGFSLIHFLREGVFEVIRFPIFLLTDFINLVPLVLLPNKTSFLLDPADYGYVAFSPGGAQNSFFSFMINFGVFGTLLALAWLGGFLSYLKNRDRNLLDRVAYVLLAGWLGFTFFREPFFLSVVKTMFQFSYAGPLLIVVSLQLASIFLRKLHGGANRTTGINPPETPAQARS